MPKEHIFRENFMYSVKIGLYRLIDTVKWLWFQLKLCLPVEILLFIILAIAIWQTDYTLADLKKPLGLLIVFLLALPLIRIVFKFSVDFMKALLFLFYLPLYVVVYSMHVWMKEFAINVKILRRLYYRN